MTHRKFIPAADLQRESFNFASSYKMLALVSINGDVGNFAREPAFFKRKYSEKG